MLKKVLIGMNCFTKKKSENDKNAYGLYVKSCELLRELKIGNHSFEEYSVCEIENVGSLELIEVGDVCFKNVSELMLIGMKLLKKVLIGNNCFTKKDNERITAWTGNRYRAVTKRVDDQGVYVLYVKNCELLRELKIGNHSFEEYSVCEIENVGSLELIEVRSECFKNVSELKLKSDCSKMRMMTRFA